MTRTRRDLLAFLDELREQVRKKEIDTVLAYGIGSESDVWMIGGEGQDDDTLREAVETLDAKVEIALAERESDGDAKAKAN